jgi:hypothetical protein
MRVFGFDLLPYPERNQGAMPHEMFLRQGERFSAEVLPDLRRHDVTQVLAA